MDGPENIQMVNAFNGVRKGQGLIEFEGNQRSEDKLDGKFFHYRGTLKDNKFEL